MPTDKERAQKKEYYLKNREERCAYQREWHHANKESSNAYAKDYYWRVRKPAKETSRSRRPIMPTPQKVLGPRPRKVKPAPTPPPGEKAQSGAGQAAPDPRTQVVQLQEGKTLEWN